MTTRASLAVVLLALVSLTAEAGPPFLTDDPEPVPLHHYEFYAFSTLDRSHGVSSIAIPAFEFNVGAAPNLQLHIVAPAALLEQPGAPHEFGLGDMELGAKYRFLDETPSRPQIGTFVMLELPTGSAQRGLGNGQLWAKVPLWIQKSWGPWTTYGGAGWVINHAPGMRDHPFAGWEVQRDLGPKVTLGVEWFDTGRDSSVTRSANLINVGSYTNVTRNFSILTSIGRTFSGDLHTIAYFGLYWTWGRKDE